MYVLIVTLWLRILFAVVSVYSCMLAITKISNSENGGTALRYIKTALVSILLFSALSMLCTALELIDYRHIEYNFMNVVMSILRTIGLGVQAYGITLLSNYILGTTEGERRPI